VDERREKMTDDQLYRDYLDGDSTAGDRLMLRYGDSLTAYLDGFLHDPQDAEDIMLDCFAAIFVDRPRIGEGKFRAYLFRTAWHKACRMRKLRSKRQ
jgi:RNA polymerase sigma-70 factor (ECF subfamily)